MTAGARLHVREAERPESRSARQQRLVDAFLAGSRHGDFAALLEVLDPDVVLRANPAAVRMGASAEVRGAAAVADTFKERAQAARPALVDSAPGLVWAPGGRARVVFEFAIGGEKIVAINLQADPEHIARLDPVVTGN